MDNFADHSGSAGWTLTLPARLAAHMYNLGIAVSANTKTLGFGRR